MSIRLLQKNNQNKSLLSDLQDPTGQYPVFENSEIRSRFIAAI
jgi:hypothetical protein